MAVPKRTREELDAALSSDDVRPLSPAATAKRLTDFLRRSSRPCPHSDYLVERLFVVLPPAAWDMALHDDDFLSQLVVLSNTSNPRHRKVRCEYVLNLVVERWDVWRRTHRLIHGTRR